MEPMESIIGAFYGEPPTKIGHGARDYETEAKMKGMKPRPDAELAAIVRKRIPARHHAEEVRRLSLTMDGEDAQLLNDVAELLLDLRQAARGGTREVKGSRHWVDPITREQQ